MISERQKQIIKLLHDRDLTVNQLARKINVSERTISRDIRFINEELKNIAQINIEGFCKLEVFSEIKLFELLQERIPDKIKLLFLSLTSDELSLDEACDKLYISKAKLKELLKSLNEEYAEFIIFDLKQGTGIIIRANEAVKMDFLVNLLIEYPDLRKNLGFTAPDRSQLIFNYKAATNQFLTKDQLQVQLFVENYYKSSIFIKDKLELIYLLNIQRKKISEIIDQIFIENGFEEPNNNLTLQILNHISRSAILPLYILKNKSDVNAYLQRQPAAFDMAKKISLTLNQEYSPLYINPYYLGLYIMMALSIEDKSIYKLILVSQRPAVSSINKNIIEERIKGSRVFVVGDLEEIDLKNKDYTIILDAELIKNYKQENIDYIVSSLITDSDIEKIQSIVRHKTFDKLLENARKAYTYELTNQSSDFIDLLSDFLDELIQKDLISSIEKDALLNRERAGNQLVIENFSLPHIISASEKDFRLFEAILKRPVVVNNQFIDRILVVVIGTEVVNKSEIFNYLYEVINEKSI